MNLLPQPPANTPRDALGRGLRDLRISVTDRCNFRCTYCMPRAIFRADHTFLPRRTLLSFEEITRLAGCFVQLGVRKLRLTGGEPLMRRGLEALVQMLGALRDGDGRAPEVALTTNASLLAQKAVALKAAGLARVTISLDALDESAFRRMSDSDFPLTEVLAGIEAARDAGLSPIKINAVIIRGRNENQIPALAHFCRERSLTLRLIEFMDAGNHTGWRAEDVVSSAEMLALLRREFALSALPATHLGETALRFRYDDKPDAEIGLIASVSQPFCRHCNRARLSSAGEIFPCLFAASGFDLAAPLRAGESDAQLRERIAAFWQHRQDRYSEIRRARAPDAAARKVEMHFIGG